MEDTRNQAGESPPAALPVLRAATAPPPMAFAHTPTLTVRPVSLGLSQFVAERFSAGEDRQCIVRACEAGGGGDCLFHSIAAALELMIQIDSDAATHVLARLPLHALTGTKSQAVAHLRHMSVDSFWRLGRPKSF